MSDRDTILVLFDGVCNLCNGAVKFIIKRDPKNVFTFASLQSDKARSELRRFGIRSDSFHSMLVIHRDRCYERSDAALYIVRHLQRPWSWLYALKIIPRFIRNAVYNLIAQYRYKLFGRQDACMLPTPELKARFVG
jgi:predicted DCC family thiol-disulfide oxidoreductase YuxK